MKRSLVLSPLSTSLALLLATAPLRAQTTAEDIRELHLRDWQPTSMLVTPKTQIQKPAFPAIDVHNHLGGGADHLTRERVEFYLRAMDDAGVATVVNLDGGWGTKLQQTLRALDESHPGRFLTYALINF